MGKPLLTVCLITYNQARYVKKAIDSVLSQKVEFRLELIVADDFSTDGTREILLEYKQKFPEKIKLILQKKNVGAETNWLDLMAYPKSKYVIYMEGDDYFTDSKKLQKQVNFLEAHKEFSLCFHPVKVVYENDPRSDEIFPSAEFRQNKKVMKLKDLLAYNFIQTNSAMYRWRFAEEDIKKIFPRDVMPGDWLLHILHAEIGKIGFIDSAMSVYRKHPGGMWWNAYHNKDKFWEKYSLPHFAFFVELLKLYGDDKDNRDVIYFSMGNICYELQEVDNKHGTKLLKGLLIKYPDIIGPLLAEQHKKIQTAQKLKSNEAHEVKLLKQTIKLKEDHIKKLDAQSYQMVEEISRIKKQPIRSVAQKYLRRGDKLNH